MEAASSQAKEVSPMMIFATPGCKLYEIEP
jgi:hypothetical protein